MDSYSNVKAINDVRYTEWANSNFTSFRNLKYTNCNGVEFTSSSLVFEFRTRNEDGSYIYVPSNTTNRGGKVYFKG